MTNTEDPGSDEALEVLRAAANDPGVTIDEFDDIVLQMWNARTLPNGLAHIYSLSDGEFLRDILRDEPRKPRNEETPEKSRPAPEPVQPQAVIVAPANDDEDGEYDYGDDYDDDPSGCMPGMTLGPEDEAHNEWLASLTDDDMDRLAQGLKELMDEKKKTEKPG